MGKFENANQTTQNTEISQEMLNETQRITNQNLGNNKSVRKNTDEELNRVEIENVTTGKHRFIDSKEIIVKPIPEYLQDRKNQPVKEKRRKGKKQRNKRKKTKRNKTLSQSEDGKTTRKLQNIDYSTENAITDIITLVKQKYENQISTESTKDDGEKFSEKFEMETKEQQKITSDKEGGVTDGNQYWSVDHGENVTAHHKEIETDQSNEDELNETTKLRSEKQSENQKEMLNGKVTEDIETNNRRIEQKSKKSKILVTQQ
uniref:Uncharacterized protein n=1 Tax=Trichobilharzia regenti TaxID=157069 RepID=A0AA85JSY7_TRIRE|nr:unnamed protein product [Trichobilharzia regenti]